MAPVRLGLSRGMGVQRRCALGEAVIRTGLPSECPPFKGAVVVQGWEDPRGAGSSCSCAPGPVHLLKSLWNPRARGATASG